MQIVERTGSSIYAVDLKAQVGDLSGITDNSFSDGVTGHGLYTTNGYFKGKIEVASLPKPPSTDDLILYYPLQGSFLGATGIAATADQSGNGHDSRDHANGLVDVTFISGSDSGPTGGALAFDTFVLVSALSCQKPCHAIRPNKPFKYLYSCRFIKRLLIVVVLT